MRNRQDQSEMNPAKLTKKEIDVLKIISDAEAPLSASEINSSDAKFNINTVQSALRKLLKENYIKVADIGYSGTVLCRKYDITEEASEVLLSYVNESYAQLAKDFSLPTLVAYLFQKETDAEQLRKDIQELDEIIKQYKE